MKSIHPFYISIVFVAFLSAVPCLAADFFYLVLQWSGSYCSAKHGCCYPKSGKPARDFTIAGLCPGNLDATIPQFCDSQNHFNIAKVVYGHFTIPMVDLIMIGVVVQGLKPNPKLARKLAITCLSKQEKLWSLEPRYFEAALRLKKQVNLLKILTNAGIQPNGKFYDRGGVVEESIRRAVGYMPGFWCNQDKSGNHQLYQVVLCSDVQGTKIMDCPGIPIGKCSQSIKFPPF